MSRRIMRVSRWGLGDGGGVVRGVGREKAWVAASISIIWTEKCD